MRDRALLDAEDAKVTEALRFVGINVNSVYDLVNTREKYTRAIPVLVKLLREVQHPRIKEGIARALATRQASTVADELIHEFETMETPDRPSEIAKWAIGNALAVAATDETVEAIARLMRDKRHGSARSMLPLALTRARTRRALAVSALLDALNDAEMICQAASALARLRATEALPVLRQLQVNPDKDVQKALSKALKQLEAV